MTICIAGMHRSGTSMVARILNKCGVYLGEDKYLIKGQADNPGGFWENFLFVNINDDILSLLGGAWDMPPQNNQPGWENSSLFDHNRAVAQSLISDITAHAPWGWKDPRNSLTLPFWKNLIPDLKVVVCVRNPVEVAKSLYNRGYSTPAFSGNLWKIYYQRLYTAISPEKVLVTHYEAMFYDAEAELNRLLSFLGISATQETISSALDAVSLSLRHNKSDFSEISGFFNDPEIVGMYFDLCAQAGPIFDLSLLDDENALKNKHQDEIINLLGGELLAKNEIINSFQKKIFQREAEIAQLLLEKEQAILLFSKEQDKKEQEVQVALEEKEETIRSLSNELDEKEQFVQVALEEKEETIQLLSNELDEKKQDAQRLSGQLDEKEALLLAKDETIDKYVRHAHEQKQVIDDFQKGLQKKNEQLLFLERMISGLNLQLSEIYNSLGWRLLTRFRNFKLMLFPINSLQERLFQYGLRSYHIWRTEGLVSLLKRMWGKVRRRSLTSRANSQNPVTEQQRFVIVEEEKKQREYVYLSEKTLKNSKLRAMLIAFYLPQFHPIPENDMWWGKGFTEWANVSKASPNFEDHYQPHLPGELGFYDLRVPDIQMRQVELAKKYGISGFCFYYYWFNGRRLLEHPLDQFIENNEIDFPFCICWANENWTRRWDGEENNILLEQNYSEDSYLAFIQDIAPILQDDRYIRVDGKPLLLIYRIDLLPDPDKAVDIWRSACREMQIGDIYIAVVQSFGISDPRPFGCDAAIEFPPHYLGDAEVGFNAVIDILPNFRGRLFDYGAAAKLMQAKRPDGYTLYKSIMPSWDNTARRQNDSHIFINSSPEVYKHWLENIVLFSEQSMPENNRFVFINAWNEWAEGTHLEPDQKYGYAYLQATADVIAGKTDKTPLSSRDSWKILFISHDAHRGGAQAVLLHTIEWFYKHTSVDIKLLCLQGGEWLERFSAYADTVVLQDVVLEGTESDYEQVAKAIIRFCGGKPDIVYGNTVVAAGVYPIVEQIGAPIITHVHEMATSVDRYARNSVNDLVNHTDYFIACSSSVRKYLKDDLNITDDKLEVIYSSIKPDENFSKSLTITEKRKRRKKLGLLQDKLLVFGCGIGMPFRKGADIFIELGELLLQNGYKDFHLYWIGYFDTNYRDTEYGTWIHHYSKTQKGDLKKHITFLGLKENPREYLVCGDIFVLPSREDPFPLVALEAADCSLPVICFDEAGGMPDFVGNDAGFVIPYLNVAEMAEKIIALGSDEKMRTEKGMRSKEKLLNRFVADQTNRDVFSVCRKIAKKKPSVSIIVPNYNHAPYLEDRLDSIYGQTFQDFEVILLDDASSDNSTQILNRYSHYFNTQIVLNDKNSGSPFKQWMKGIKLAEADVLWIAESDDICDATFLETLLPAFKKQDVKLAYANSHIIDGDTKIIGDYIETDYLASLSKTKWLTDYEIDSSQEVNDGLGVKNTILNISASLIRKFHITEDFEQVVTNMGIAGDWYFLAHAIRKGLVHYRAEKLNFHRRHSSSVIAQTVSGQKLQAFFSEMEIVQAYIFKEYKLQKGFLKKWEYYLRKQWHDFSPDQPFDNIEQYYAFDKLKEQLSRLNV